MQVRTIERGEFPHLSDLEWATLERMGRAVGPKTVGAMLHMLSAHDQHASIAQFTHRELEEAHERAGRLDEIQTQLSHAEKQRVAQAEQL